MAKESWSLSGKSFFLWFHLDGVCIWLLTRWSGCGSNPRVLKAEDICQRKLTPYLKERLRWLNLELHYIKFPPVISSGPDFHPLGRYSPRACLQWLSSFCDVPWPQGWYWGVAPWLVLRHASSEKEKWQVPAPLSVPMWGKHWQGKLRQPSMSLKLFENAVLYI